MTSGTTSAGDGMHVVGDCLIVSVHREPGDDDLRALRRRILNKLEVASVRGALIDMSRVRVLDSVLFGILVKTALMIKLLGRRSVFVGFQAGVASALVDLDVDLDSVETALTMEDGLELLRGLERDRADDDDSQAEEPRRTAEDEPGEVKVDLFD